MAKSTSSDCCIAIFQRKEVRRTLHNNEWWFVITDVIAVLTDTSDVKSYMRDMRRRDPELDKGWGKISHPPSFARVGTVCTPPHFTPPRSPGSSSTAPPATARSR